MQIRHIKVLPPVLLCLLLIFSCATKKSKTDVSPLGKIYHNITAKYNGYFNAKVLLQESTDKLNVQHRDNYNKILDLYPYMAVENVQSEAPDLDKAIEKVSVVVALHRVSHWSDDCYLLMGKSQFLKQDFESAEETLRYLSNEYNPDKLRKGKRKSRSKMSAKEKAAQKEREKEAKEDAKKEREKAREAKQDEREKRNKEKKKESEQKAKDRKKKNKDKKKSGSKKKVEPKQEEAIKEVIPTKADSSQVAAEEKEEETKPIKEAPSNSPFKHRPCFQEGQLWLARTFIERQNYDDASMIMNQLDTDPGTFKDVRRDLSQVQAYYFLKQKQYTQAIPALEKALTLAKTKKEKARIAYIIAQLQLQNNKPDAAFANFNKVLKFKPDYEMAFNAKLNIALSAWQNGKASADQAIASLGKMTKDVKNAEYLDQVYYYIASIHLKNGRKSDAIDNFKLSLANSKDNRSQKSESYYALATLYFEGEDYVNAKNYYDSTLTTMIDKDERYKDVVKYSTGLTEIAANIKVIQLQDSLLVVAAMSEKDKKDLAKRIKTAREKEQAEAAAKANATVAAGPLARTSRDAGGKAMLDPTTGAQAGIGGGKPSTFFAYNDASVRKGKRDFEKKWGDRVLEDNWRRSNKREGSEIKADDGNNLATSDSDNADWASILGDLPDSPEKALAANKLIEEAMYKLGTLYRDRLDNHNKCAVTLEKMLQRYPDTKHELEAWYYLYLAFTDLNNRTKAQEYYDKIVKKYPESTYARVLKDPNYLASTKEEEKKLMRYYDSAYQDFEKGRYKDAIQKIDAAPQKFGVDNELKAKFALLNAMCLGNTQSKEAYIAGLKVVISKFPNTAEEKRAKEIMRLLDGKLDEEQGLVKAANESGPKSSYKADPDKLHYVIAVITGKNNKIEDAKVSVSDFNREYHKLDDLKISNIALNPEQSIIVIRKFKDKTIAMRYYEGVQKNAKDFMDKNTTYSVFPISQDNYRELLRLKSLEEYQTFFEENYLK